MDHIECLNELVLDLDHMLIKCINEFTKVLLLVSHLHILIDLLQHWKQVCLVDQTANVVQNVSSLLEVVISKRAQQRLLESP